MSHGFIDDSEIAFPDDDDLAALKQDARGTAERRRAPARRRRSLPGTCLMVRTDAAQSAG